MMSTRFCRRLPEILLGMHSSSPFGRVATALFLALCVLFLGALPANARVAEGTEVSPTEDGYSLEVEFGPPLLYLNHQLSADKKTLLIQLRPMGADFDSDDDSRRELSERIDVSWDKSAAPEITRIVYDGSEGLHPTLTVTFSRAMLVTGVENGRDLRSVVIGIRTPGNKGRTRVSEVPRGGPARPTEEELQAQMLPPLPPEQLDQMITEAEAAITSGDYPLAIRDLTRIVRSPENVHSARAQELLGLARESNGQAAQAKEEYQEYIRRFPNGEGKDRVRQRLAALLTVDRVPTGKIEPGKAGKATGKPAWKTDFYGSFSTFYNRDQFSTDEDGATVSRSDVSTSLDAHFSARKDGLDVRGNVTAGVVQDVRSGPDGGDTQERISAANLEVRDENSGLFGGVGRQSSRKATGVMTRFDGVVAGYNPTDTISVKGAFGFPVYSTKDMPIDDRRRFFAFNAEFRDILNGLDAVLYFVNQTADGLTDRRSVGAEIRYRSKSVNVFSLVDYDVFQDQLNLLLLDGHWRVGSKTQVHVTVDYRNSPLLTSSNAIRGQGVDRIRDLFPIYSDEEIFQLADDRTARSKSASFSVTQDLSERFQLTGYVTLSKIGPTPESGGVPGDPGTRTEKFYSLQLLASKLFLKNDITVLEARFADTTGDDIYTLNLSTRFPIGSDLRISPRVRLDYRDAKNGTSQRMLVRPQVRLEYQLRPWLRFEVEGGAEIIDETISNIDQNSTGWFTYVGFISQW